ncbi:MAG: sulfur carrier protein ThiS [Lachnobacterium sp.]|jgi:sulfur carrier protein|nr:sulfur carrier protein ThiS [Lachnobacterium sp.]MCI7086812.1 sulfur carrier protein ThiS [Lachnobacterium sp.]MCI7531481.1 sulfur carrier protein ThiS [Lachnobacterium sp.]MDD7714114.1 sulfur carrier protein ThiS [Lachnobacterium sp.]MDY5461527.1 sulfur carrier protein ThiS [Agathobacter sp.]
MVHINGKDIDAAGQTLKAYLDASDYEPGTFVVECNEEIVHKEDYEGHVLKDGDVVEIVQFMGGGAC